MIKVDKSNLKHGEHYLMYNTRGKCVVIGTFNRKVKNYIYMMCSHEVNNIFARSTNLKDSWSGSHIFGANWEFFDISAEEFHKHVLMETI
jgi:hypothetical protein